MKRASKFAKRRTLAVLAVGLIAAVVLTAATIGLGRPSVPDGAVIFVDGLDDGEVSRAEFDRSLEQAAAGLGLEQVPAEDDPSFASVRDETAQQLIVAKWFEGEIKDRGIEITEADIDAQVEEIRASAEGNEKELNKSIIDSKFCTEEEINADTEPLQCADVRRRARLIRIEQALGEEFTVEPDVSDSDIEAFYEENIEQFEQPASRTVRQIVNEDKAKVEQAKQELGDLAPGDEGYGKRWAGVVDKFSEDQASKDSGGLIEGLVEGQGDPAVDEMIFSAEVGELVGPFKTDRGFYLVQVVEATEATTQSLKDAKPLIEQQLVGIRGQFESQEAQADFAQKWQSRTYCEEIALVQSCENFVQPDPASLPGGAEVDTGPPVQSSTPIEPGTAVFSQDGAPQAGLPQRPRGIGDPCAPEDALPDPCGPDELSAPDPAAGGLPDALPEGAIPVGPDGAPAGGGAPPAGAPPAGAPPAGGGAPPGAGGGPGGP